MAHFNVSISGISGDMVGALADFVEREWGDFGMVEIEPVANGQTSATTYPSIGAVEIQVPDPVPATSAIEVIIPPEPIDDFTEPARTSPRKGR